MLLHFLNATGIKWGVKHLNDIDTVEDYLSIRKKLLSHNVIIVIKIHSYSLNLVSYGYWETFKVIDNIFFNLVGSTLTILCV